MGGRGPLSLPPLSLSSNCFPWGQTIPQEGSDGEWAQVQPRSHTWTVRKGKWTMLTLSQLRDPAPCPSSPS